MSASNKTVNVVTTQDDYEWLVNEAKSGPYQYASTLARYLLAEKIQERRSSSVEAKSEISKSESGSDSKE